MQKAAKRAERTIAVLSSNFLKSHITAAEWDAAFELDPRGERGQLIPIRVQKRKFQGILAELCFVDFVDANSDQCRQRLWDVVDSAISEPEESKDPFRALDDAVARWKEKLAFFEK